MDEPATNPIIIALLFMLRCLVPVAVMLGVSYVLRRWGWITEPPPPPTNGNDQAPEPEPDRPQS